MMDSSLIKKELDQLKEDDLFRTLEKVNPISPGEIEIDGKIYIDFSSNDYLGLSKHNKLIEAGLVALRKWGCSSRASRLISGNHILYNQLEHKLSEFKGTESALVFGNGFLCNVSIISSLVGANDAIFLDRLCHASIIDGALLSRARLFRFNHNDISHLEELLKKNRKRYKKALVVAESVYSMDGDLAPIDDLIRVCKEFDVFFLLDEAHAIGVFGENGEGLVKRDSKNKPDILMGTFGKALGSYGAFCCISKELKDYFINRARGIIYSTALPPSVLSINISSLDILKEIAHKRKNLINKAEELRTFIKNEIQQKTKGHSQIVPLILSSVRDVLHLESYLKIKGIFVKAIRPPTVPKNSPRIRISLCACHSDTSINYLKECLYNFFKK